MRIAVRRMLLLAPLALAVVIPAAVAEAGQGQDRPRDDFIHHKVGSEGHLDSPRGRGRVRSEAARTAASAAPAREPGRPALAAPPAHVPAPAAPPASVLPPGVILSDDAPDAPPAIGVIGGGESKGPSPTPEPSSMLLMGAGLAGLYRLARRQRE